MCNQPTSHAIVRESGNLFKSYQVTDSTHLEKTAMHRAARATMARMMQSIAQQLIMYAAHDVVCARILYSSSLYTIYE
jgi:hypothetical protein